MKSKSLVDIFFGKEFLSKNNFLFASERWIFASEKGNTSDLKRLTYWDLLAGRFVGEGTLLRFYVLHCVGFPLIAATLMAIHFWRVRKDGGISGPL